MTDSSEGVSVPLNTENYELWIRMATDNKINTTNSWNFALIDYFHDFTMLRDGDSVNFQKASTTLDGCVKIYSSRIDSAANETGQLLSGLSNHEKPKEDGEYALEEDYDPQNSSSRSKRNKKNMKTLLPSFESVRIKDDDRPVKSDPVFKKALADFDEGGSKSLLTNILRISNTGKIVFDTTKLLNDSIDPIVTKPSNKKSIDFSRLNDLVFDLIEDYDVCPSLTDLVSVSNGTSSAGELLDKIDNMTFINTAKNAYLSYYNNGNGVSDVQGNTNFFDDNVDMDISMGGNVDIDDGSNSKAANISKRTEYSLFLDGVPDSDHSGPNLTLTKLFDETINPNTEDEDDGVEDSEGTIDMQMLDYFDKLPNNYNSRGSNEHWKILRFRKQYMNDHFNSNISMKSNFNKNIERFSALGSSCLEQKRKLFNKKEFAIDFMSNDDYINEDKLFRPPDYASKIRLPEKERALDGSMTVLPEDFKFTTKRLAFLTLKPNQMINSVLVRRHKLQEHQCRENDQMLANESFFADAYHQIAQENECRQKSNDILDDSILDDGFDLVPDNDYINANEMDEYERPLNHSQNSLKSSQQAIVSSQNNMFSQRSTGITYARTSKKVDIRLLKQNIWDSIEQISVKKKKRSASHFEDEEWEETELRLDSDQNETGYGKRPVQDPGSLRFTDVVRVMSHKYTDAKKAELSTSFCFICLLHLANEQGLTLETDKKEADILIYK